MSSFICDKCGKQILDTPYGYITGCEHYPLEGTGIKPLIPDRADNKMPILPPVMTAKPLEKRNIVEAIPYYLLTYSDEITKLAGYIPTDNATLKIVKYGLIVIGKALQMLRKRYKP